MKTPKTRTGTGHPDIKPPAARAAAHHGVKHPDDQRGHAWRATRLWPSPKPRAPTLYGFAEAHGEDVALGAEGQTGDIQREQKQRRENHGLKKRLRAADSAQSRNARRCATSGAATADRGHRRTRRNRERGGPGHRRWPGRRARGTRCSPECFAARLRRLAAAFAFGMMTRN